MMGWSHRYYIQSFVEIGLPVSEKKIFEGFWRKIGQGHSKVIIRTNYDELEHPMLHTKFCGNRPAGSGEKDF